MTFRVPEAWVERAANSYAANGYLSDPIARMRTALEAAYWPLTDDMVERAAKIIAANDREWEPEQVELEWRAWCDEDKRMFLRCARAALEAALRPSDSE